ncbi:MAG TPA: DUF1641 domain-containing protein [Bryobacteraceae bacterium]|nr:DUF1641 domain-containing protein [Bryobacteraceae bacterium]
MAQPISFIPAPQAPAPHAEAIDSALDLLQLLHDRGVLDLLRALAGAGDQVVDIVATALNSPDAIRGMRNFLLLTKFFATIPPEVLGRLVQAATEGASREKSTDPPTLLQLMRRMNTPDARHGMAVLIDLLQSAGKGL